MIIAELFRNCDGPGRQRIIREYEPLVTRIVAREHARWQNWFDRQRLMQLGMAVLEEMLINFKRHRHAQFSAALARQIRRRIMLAAGVETAAAGRPEGERTVSVEELEAMAQREEAEDEDTRPSAQITDWLAHSVSNRDTPDSMFLLSEAAEIVARAMDRLPDNEVTCLSACFWGGMQLKEVGEMLGVSESRACQIRKNALRKLREQARLIEHLREFAEEYHH